MFLILCALAQASEGISAKGLTVSPYVDLGATFTPNVYRTPGNPKPAAGLLLRPGVDLRWETPDFTLGLTGVATRRQVLLVLGDDVAAWQLSRTDLDLDTTLLLRPRRPLQVVVREQAQRKHSLAPSSLALADGKGLTVRQRSITQAGVRYTPGGGALRLQLLGRGQVDNYNVSVGTLSYLVPTSTNTRVAGGGDAEIRWSFFPRTDLVLSGGAEAYAWAGTQLPGWGWNAQLGIFGRVDYPLVINAAVGFSQLRDGGVVSTTPIDGVIGNVAAVWSPTRHQRLSLGYTKGLEDSWYAPYLAFHKVAGSYAVSPSRRLDLKTTGSTRWEAARGISYQDLVVGGRVQADYALSEQLSVGAQAGVDWRLQAGWDVPLSLWLHMGW